MMAVCQVCSVYKGPKSDLPCSSFCAHLSVTMTPPSLRRPGNLTGGRNVLQAAFCKGSKLKLVKTDVSIFEGSHAESDDAG